MVMRSAVKGCRDGGAVCPMTISSRIIDLIVRFVPAPPTESNTCRIPVAKSPVFRGVCPCFGRDELNVFRRAVADRSARQWP